MPELLKISDLTIEFATRRKTIKAARNINLTVNPGEVLGLVGESGAGKSTIGNAIIDLLESPGRIASGSILFQDRELCGLSLEDMRAIRGNHIGMIFQDPQTALNPLITIGDQLIETIIKTREFDIVKAREHAIQLLNDVGIEEAELRLKAYPHQFSGGMRQRVVIALALAGEPKLVIADEPTTALDVAIQAQILNLIKQLCQKRQLGVIIVTHDIGVIASIANRVSVMYRGQIIETGDVAQVLGAPEHDYTKALISAVPRADKKLNRFEALDYFEGDDKRKSIDISTHWLGQGIDQNLMQPLVKTDRPVSEIAAVSVKNLDLSFTLKNALFKKNRKMLKAVDDVSFNIKQGETFGIVGSSGSGKSTIARLIAGLYKPDKGEISIMGQNILGNQRDRKVKAARRTLQMIFQDPYSSLNARMNVLNIIAEPVRFYQLTNSEDETRQIVSDLLDHVGLGAEVATRYPHEFSGGQRQRISIARALATRARILICDEPTSALDVSIQAQILNLLKDLQQDLGLTMLFISHDLPVIRQTCDRVAVMREGKICEMAQTEQLFTSPQHDYSRHLLNLVPKLDLSGS